MNSYSHDRVGADRGHGHQVTDRKHHHQMLAFLKQIIALKPGGLAPLITDRTPRVKARAKPGAALQTALSFIHLFIMS